MEKMNYIKGITYGSFAPRGSFEKQEAYSSMDNLLERTGANFIILVPMGVQDTPQSETIDYLGEETLGEAELVRMIEYIHAKGARVCLKPTVNCRNGVWRAFINFFDNEVPCEPKWSNWFKAYTAFQMYFAKIAERTGCEMFIPGCEMVMAQRRDAQWRKLIADLRTVYHGPISYNTDKYQEENVSWWDAVDVISSSGYYPKGDWENQLRRIKKTVDKYDKPFFFAECGCMSTEGSWNVPNDWGYPGEVNLEQQARWYQEMFDTAGRTDWVQSFALWDWAWDQYPLEKACEDAKYDIYGKPAEKVVAEFYRSR